MLKMFQALLIPGLCAAANVTVLVQSSSTVRSIDKGAHSSITSSRHVVVRTQAEWDALWQEHLPTRDRPPVDFTKEMVVGVFLGSRPTAGYGVTIVSAEAKGGVLHVEYRETRPRAGTYGAQVITFPYHLVAIPKSPAKDVKFEKVE
jgi:protease stability complex PrcB-like protein